jgi:hypothetical protein
LAAISGHSQLLHHRAVVELLGEIETIKNILENLLRFGPEQSVPVGLQIAAFANSDDLSFSSQRAHARVERIPHQIRPGDHDA